MTTDNPYDSPTVEPAGSPPSPRLLAWSVIAVFGSALLGGVMGTCIGAALGALAPGYYRSVFSRGDSAAFDPVAVGIGQGLSQGIVLGGIVGLILVGMFYWYRARAASNQS